MKTKPISHHIVYHTECYPHKQNCQEIIDEQTCPMLAEVKKEYPGAEAKWCSKINNAGDLYVEMIGCDAGKLKMKQVKEKEE